MHTLENGEYLLVPTETLRDDCGLAGEDVLGPATLRTEGNLVTLNLSRPGLRLVGTYRFSLEEMTMDGTLSNTPFVLRGQECLLDSVSYHLDTQTSSPTTFSGAMSISYEARSPDACACKYWFKFDARRR